MAGETVEEIIAAVEERVARLAQLLREWTEVLQSN